MASPQQSSPQQFSSPLTIQQKREAITGLAFYPALTLFPFLRSKGGFNLFQPGSVVVMTILMLILNAVANFHVAIPLMGRMGAREQSDALKYFAFVFFALAIWNRRERWKKLLVGERWHNFSHGISRLEFLPIRQDLIYRMVDPAAAFLAGCVARKLGFGPLGLWWMFASTCLFLVENYSHEKALERDLAVLDSLLESEVAGSTVAHFEGQDVQAKARSLRDTGGIPTGADAGLEAQIAKRKREASACAEGDSDVMGVRA